MTKLPPALLICLALSASAGMPALDAPAAPPGPAPQIAPLDRLLASVPAPGTITPQDPTGLAARATALRDRANALQGPVNPPAAN